MNVLAERETGHCGAPQPDLCWQAVYSRDARFDGRFFAGAVTTRVYCRSICPAPFAKPDKILWFASAAAAETAGFRPCRRCRSAASPGTPAWLGTSAVVSRALRLIAEGALDSGNVDDLAGRVGLGSRHLAPLVCRASRRVAHPYRHHAPRALRAQSDRRDRPAHYQIWPVTRDSGASASSITRCARPQASRPPNSAGFGASLRLQPRSPASSSG